ncbi:hypothetical protein VNO77_17487 [Canavalia gladiata]|uniref:Uncharacterized protein n=1 Tax=Canavalia gladiata TaxID=3824 RepID=A0AAN9QMR6_CANGL
MVFQEVILATKISMNLFTFPLSPIGCHTIILVFFRGEIDKISSRLEVFTHETRTIFSSVPRNMSNRSIEPFGLYNNVT